MANPAQAYGKMAKLGNDPRELEANLLLRAASQLQKVRDNWEPRSKDILPALHFNRQLWSIFATSVTGGDSELPREIRENLANLSLFIFKQTLEVQTSSDPQKLDSLININRQIAAGLFQKPIVETTETAP